MSQLAKVIQRQLIFNILFLLYKQGSRFCVNATIQISKRYSGQMQASMKQKRLMMLGQMYFSMIEYPKHDWHVAFGTKGRAIGVQLCMLRPHSYIIKKVA